MQATQPHHYFVYIFGSTARSSIKVGVTGDLQQQVQEISNEAASVNEQHRLVYYEHYAAEEIARNREREILKGGEDSAYRLIESMNPNWLDLSDTLV